MRRITTCLPGAIGPADELLAALPQYERLQTRGLRIYIHRLRQRLRDEESRACGSRPCAAAVMRWWCQSSRRRRHRRNNARRCRWWYQRYAYRRESSASLSRMLAT